MDRKTIKGQVLRKSEKSVIVEYPVIVRNRKYMKSTKMMRKIMAHDARNESSVGDEVEISETSPKSARKSWEIVKIVK